MQEPGSATLTHPAVREAYLDRIKVVLVAGIIAVHGVVGYSGFEGGWAYQPVREVRLAEATDMAVGTVLLPALLFVMGIFFLVSGLVVPGSLARHGARGFVRERLVRLGVPYAVWVLLVWPAVVFAPRRVAGWEGSYWQMFLDARPFLDAGPLWFVGVLLLYSLVYAAWRAWHPRDPVGDGGAPVGAGDQGRALALVALGISAATVLVRPVFPFDSHQVAEIQLWQWPQYVGMFGLGVVAAERGWLRPVPDRLRRRCGLVALVSTLAWVGLFGAVLVAGLDPGEAFAGPAWGWAPVMIALVEGPLVVGASVWLLAVAQRHLDRTPGPRGRVLARSAYAAYLVQGFVLIALAVALRPVDLGAELKALVVGVAGVAASFGIAWLLVSRTPVGRVV